MREVVCQVMAVCQVMVCQVMVCQVMVVCQVMMCQVMDVCQVEGHLGGGAVPQRHGGCKAAHFLFRWP